MAEVPFRAAVYFQLGEVLAPCHAARHGRSPDGVLGDGAPRPEPVSHLRGSRRQLAPRSTGDGHYVLLFGAHEIIFDWHCQGTSLADPVDINVSDRR